MGDVRNIPQTEAGLSRRRFIGYLIAAPTLMTSAELLLGGATPARADGLPSAGQIAEHYDLIDFLRDAQLPTSNLISITVNEDDTVGFDLHRTEVGQGITTSIAMVIADEMGLPLDRVDITLADARPELLFNQITGGSHSMYSLYTPVRVAAALAKRRLLEAAALLVGGEAGRFEIVDGVVRGPNGETFGIGELAAEAAAVLTEAVSIELTDEPTGGIVGTPRKRRDARALVTGRHQYTSDLDVADALPTMVARPPTILGSVASFNNAAVVTAMPGVTDVAVVDTGVAVRAATFGQCIDAIRAMDITWADGRAAGLDDADVERELEAAELPVLVPTLSELESKLEALGVDLDALGLRTITEPILGLLGAVLGYTTTPLGGVVPTQGGGTFTFAFQSNSPLEPNNAIADVRSDSAEIWAPLKNPIVTQQRIAADLGLSQDAVTVHVVQAGGSFGRALFSDAAYEAARISQAMGKPVKLMWHRIDEFRQGRTHPASRSTIRTLYTNELGLLYYGQSHTSVMTDFSHGLGEVLTSSTMTLPPEISEVVGDYPEAPNADLPGVGDIGFAQSVFHLTQYVPYNFGVAAQLINETNTKFPTSSMRNIYSPNVVTARELVVEQIIRDVGADSFEFRHSRLKDERSKAVMAKVAEVGQWGRAMPAGTAQGLGFHAEYKGRAACLLEVDTRPETVGRQVPDGFTGPRVTKAVFAVDVGLPINPAGIKAQMMGGLLDGIANAFTFALHLQDGRFVEGSWDQAFYTRQWNVPFEVEVVVMPPTSDTPGGVGEFGVAAAMAAAATAYYRATGAMPTHFPINHRQPLPFTPPPTTPSVPQSPTDGLNR